jgi:hypothetical protein
MRRWTPVVLVTTLGLALALPAFAQWKWRDKAGQTQYSDLPPPPGTAEQDILARPNASQRRAAAAPLAASAASAASGAASGAAPGVPSGTAVAAPRLAPKSSEPELEAKRRKGEEEAAEKKKAEEARLAVARAENCTRAKAQIRTLDSGVRVTRTNEKGEREYLDDATRAAEAQRSRGIIASDCK